MLTAGSLRITASFSETNGASAGHSLSQAQPWAANTICGQASRGSRRNSTCNAPSRLRAPCLRARMPVEAQRTHRPGLHLPTRENGQNADPCAKAGCSKSTGISLLPTSDFGKEGPCSSFAAGRVVCGLRRVFARGSEPSLASAQVHYFSAMKSSLFETANGARQQVFLIDTKDASRLIGLSPSYL